jgi:Mg2+ and Co2+ transporter CorA
VTDQPYAFEIIMGIMFLVILSMLAVFRWRRWI